jgi:hypothetical protein
MLLNSGSLDGVPTDMSLFFRRILVLTCGLLLALPPGWCCLLPQVGIRQPGKATASCCHHKDQASTPTTPKAPLPEHGPPCGCVDRDSPVPSGPKTLPVDLASVPAVVLQPVFDGGAGAVVILTTAAVASPPLNVLHCVWLC